MMRPPQLLLLLPLLAACSAPSAPNEAHEGLADSRLSNYRDLLPKLMGDWTDPVSEPGAVIHERWHQNEEGLPQGLGFVMVEKDTVFIEHLTLGTDSAGMACYQVRVPGQNNEGTVSFTLTACAGDSMVFENPAHDFPQRIVYAWSPTGEWTARVSGPGKGGGWRVLSYRFRHVMP